MPEETAESPATWAAAGSAVVWDRVATEGVSGTDGERRLVVDGRLRLRVLGVVEHALALQRGGAHLGVLVGEQQLQQRVQLRPVALEPLGGVGRHGGQLDGAADDVAHGDPGEGGLVAEGLLYGLQGGGAVVVPDEPGNAGYGAALDHVVGGVEAVEDGLQQRRRPNLPDGGVLALLEQQGQHAQGSQNNGERGLELQNVLQKVEQLLAAGSHTHPPGEAP
ncbi:peptidylprolyl isomerase [Babesia caballi]|uniref:Peptidylprolyl isomerase n=1 Tax=Babesia caballi TaxID=5871 RepID=A0AAV4M273_BABCB|nr:peptidylprolyl isomerase [Babesia caballi]